MFFFFRSCTLSVTVKRKDQSLCKIWSPNVKKWRAEFETTKRHGTVFSQERGTGPFFSSVSLMVPTLYQSCLTTLLHHSAHIEDLSGVLFTPYILDLLNLAFQDEHLPLALRRPTNTKQGSCSSINLQNLLAKIGDAHGEELRRLEYLHFGSLHLGAHSSSQAPPRLLTFSHQRNAPQFITRLDLSMTWLGDDDIPCLKYMVNLVVLDLANTLVTDYGVSHLHRFTQLTNTNARHPSPGLRHLKILSLAYNENITDGCIKYLRGMPTLCGIDLSTTNVTKSVAVVCMKKIDYVCNDDAPATHDELATSALDTIEHSARHDLCANSHTLEKERYIPSRKELCPPHARTLITYGDTPATPSTCRLIKTQNLGCLLSGTDTYESMILYCTNNGGSWRTWWKRRPSPQRTPLVLTRPTPVSKKRPLDISHPPSRSRPSTLKGPLQVKQSQDAMALLNNFQW